MRTNQQPDSQAGIQATPWDKIALAVKRDSPEGLAAFEDVYYYIIPIIRRYIRNKFRVSEQDAEDHQQGFVEQRLLQGPLLQRANPRKGKFRHLVQSALDHFVRDQLAKAQAEKRNPHGGLVSDTAAREVAAPEAPSYESERGWVKAVLAQACENTRAFYQAKKRPQIWSLFVEAELGPAGNRPALDQLARKHGFATGQAASNAIVTVQRKIGTELRKLVAQLVGDDSLVESEIQDYIAIMAEAEAPPPPARSDADSKELPPTP